MEIPSQHISSLKAVFHRWETFLDDLSEQDAVEKSSPTDWTIKDVIAHLRAWQQVSIARLEAARNNAKPDYPDWLTGTDPFEAEEQGESFNARIQALSQKISWPSVHQEWRTGFLRLLALAESIPHRDLSDTQLYPWLRGYTLADVLTGTIAHHQEHLEDLTTRPA